MPGRLDCISVGEGTVWGLNDAGGIFVREGVSPSTPAGTGWTRVAGRLAQVSAGETGLVWGVNANSGIFVREGVTSSNLTGTGWTRVWGRLAQVSCGFDEVWGLNLSGGIFRRTGVDADAAPWGTGWERCPGDLRQVSVGLTRVRSQAGTSSAAMAESIATNPGLLAEMGSLYGGDAGTPCAWPDDEDDAGVWPGQQAALAG